MIWLMYSEGYLFVFQIDCSLQFITLAKEQKSNTKHREYTNEIIMEGNHMLLFFVANKITCQKDFD